MNVKAIEGGGISVTLTNLDGQRVEVSTCAEQVSVEKVNEPRYGWFSWEIDNGDSKATR